MPTTTYISHKMVYPKKEIQDLLTELSTVTGELYTAEEVVYQPGGLFSKRVTRIHLFKRIDTPIDYQHCPEFTVTYEAQQFACVSTERELYAYLYGALAQLEHQRNVESWFNRIGLPFTDKHERYVRFFEEACELAQTGLNESQCIEILDNVFSKPVGKIDREMFGVDFTLNALASSFGYELPALTEYHLTQELRDGVINVNRERFKHYPKFMPNMAFDEASGD